MISRSWTGLLIAAMAATLMLTGGCQRTADWLFSVGSLPEYVKADGRILKEGGERYRFLGVNVYSLASRPSDQGFQCGPGFTDDQVRQLFEEMAEMGLNAVRFDVYQSFTAGGTDYSRLDLIVRLAKRYRIRLIPTLENQWQHCTEGGYKQPDWYRSGYLRPYGEYRLSYLQHVRQVVRRYREETAILMWQMINEPEIVSLNAEDQLPLKLFAERVYREISRLDPNHLICLGSGGVMPRNGGDLWYSILLDAGSDIGEAHDYGEPGQAWPPRVWLSFRASMRLNKPFFIGEVGIPSPPTSQAERARLTIAKLQAAWEKGVDGILIWAYRSGDGTDRDFDRQDPLFQAMRRFTSGRTRPKDG